MYRINPNASYPLRQRQLLERRIVKRTVRALLKAEYTLSVFDGEEEHKRSTNQKDILDALIETDEDYLYVWESGLSPVMYGWVRFVYGNDGWDVICDYTTNLESILAPVNEYADKFQ